MYICMYVLFLCALLSGIYFINSSICESPKWSQIPLGKFLFLQRKGLLIFGRNWLHISLSFYYSKYYKVNLQ